MENLLQLFKDDLWALSLISSIRTRLKFSSRRVLIVSLTLDVLSKQKKAPWTYPYRCVEENIALPRNGIEKVRRNHSNTVSSRSKSCDISVYTGAGGTPERGGNSYLLILLWSNSEDSRSPIPLKKYDIRRLKLKCNFKISGLLYIHRNVINNRNLDN